MWLAPAGPLPGRSGVVQVAHCGYVGSVSMDSERWLERRPSDGQVVEVGDFAAGRRLANDMKAAAVCAALSYGGGRAKRGSRRYGLGVGLVFTAALTCNASVYAEAAAGADFRLTASMCDPGVALAWALDASHDADLSVDCLYGGDAPPLPPPAPPLPGAPPDGALRLMSYNHIDGGEVGRPGWGVWAPVAAGGREGYLQVAVGGVWGAVCATGFDDVDADVACRQLGFASGLDAGLDDFVFPAADSLSRWRVVHMTRVDCAATGAPVPPAPSGAAGSSGAPLAPGAQRQPPASPAERADPSRSRTSGAFLACPHSTEAASGRCHWQDLAAVRCYRTRAAAASATSPPPQPPGPPAAAGADVTRVCLDVEVRRDSPAGGMPLLPRDACNRAAQALSGLLIDFGLELLGEGLACAGSSASDVRVVLKLCGEAADSPGDTSLEARMQHLSTPEADRMLAMLVQAGVGPARGLPEVDYDYGTEPTSVAFVFYRQDDGSVLAQLLPGAAVNGVVRVSQFSPPPNAPAWSAWEAVRAPPEGGEQGEPAAPGPPPAAPPRVAPSRPPQLPSDAQPLPPPTQRHSDVALAPAADLMYTQPPDPAGAQRPPPPPSPRPPRPRPPPLYSLPPLAGCYNLISGPQGSGRLQEYAVVQVDAASGRTPAMTLERCAASVRRAYGAGAEAPPGSLTMGLASYVNFSSAGGGAAGASGAGGGAPSAPPRPPPALVTLCFALVAGPPPPDGAGVSINAPAAGVGGSGEDAGGSSLPLAACGVLPCAVPQGTWAPRWPGCGGVNRNVLAMYRVQLVGAWV